MTNVSLLDELDKVVSTYNDMLHSRVGVIGRCAIVGERPGVLDLMGNSCISEVEERVLPYYLSLREELSTRLRST